MDYENDYLISQNFKIDSFYWNDHLSDVDEFVKFYNVKSNNFDSRKISLNNEKISLFLNNHGASQFHFITAVFSLYLSRIDNTKGCLLKTNIGKANTLLKVDYVEDISFKKHLENIEELYGDAVEHTGTDIENYLGDVASFYSVYDSADDLSDDESVLALNVYDDYLTLYYNCDIFSDIYIEHMLANIEFVINFVLDFPEKECRDIEIISKEEKVLISEFCRGNEIDVDGNKTLAVAFRENALKNPEVVAVDDGIDQVTYGELERSSNSVANDLMNSHGIAQGDKIALMLPRTYHFPEVVLALNKIGAAFIPIDAEYPFKRMEHMLDISESAHIITTREHAESYDFNIDFICIEDLDMDSDADVECAGNGEDLFAIMFTSGTTGLPKPIMLANKQVAGGASYLRNLYKSSPGDICGCYASFSFIVSFRMYFALYFGEGCRIFNEEEHSDSLLLLEALKRQHLNDLILPPALGLSIYENENLDLKYLLVAGSKVNDFPKREDSTQLINLYGTTEILLPISCILNDKTDYAPIGRPLNGNWAYILDKNNKQLPIGVPGEICVSGEYISPGYYNNPELTNESFINNPYSDCEANSRMYRTGDIGFYNFKGEIEIIGRYDDQLSVRGFRVESKEILKIMGDFEAIGDIYLDVYNDNLVAYYTTDEGLDIGDVDNALKSELPPFMIPSQFIELDEIPLNPNGKVDRFALRRNTQYKADVEIDDETLGCVVDAFKEVLNIGFISPDDDFVALGGNSLSSMFLQRKLKAELGVNVYVNEILELSTPENIADYIKLNLNNQISGEEINYSFSDGCPLSESQLNVYLDEMVNDMGTAYNIPYKIRFDKDYSIDELRNALNELFEAYPVLKSRIITKEGDLPSCIFDAEPEIKQGNLKDMEFFVQPFEFDKALSRFLIVEDENTLCCDFHHLIFDGSSVNILLDKLGSILNNEGSDSVDDGILRQISFEENIDSSYFNGAQEFLDSMLADRDEVYDLLPEVVGNEQSVYQATLDIDNNHLKPFVQGRGVTENQFFASVFAYTLSRFTGSSKVLFNIIGDGRGHIDLSDSVGMFARTLPVLIDCRDQNIGSFLDYSSNIINSVMKYDLYPFYVLTGEYNLNSNVLFQYSHDLFNNSSDFEVVEMEHDLDCDLSVNIFNSGEGYGIRISHSDVYSKNLIERLVDSFEAILKGIMMVANLSHIKYVSDSDMELLDTFNQTETPLAHDDVLDAFNDNLSKYPDNKLVSSRNSSYSYGEGAFIADRIAKDLKNLGVESQDNVAFLVERSELYMFCVLGIMSCGAVYVPLDDSHPDGRIKYMVEDTNSKVIIASDETYERANSLSDDVIVLNISDIIKDDIGCLSSLPISYGNLACILYTSGTTGLPKGVKITRKAILNFAEYYVNESSMGSDDVYGLFASIGFDVAIKGIFSSICSGACLNVVPEDIKLDMDKLNKYFHDYGVTHTHITTQVAKLFINAADEISLTELVTGGEKLGEIDYPQDCRFIDTYGPTEACVYVTSIDEKDKIDSSSVGYLLNNLKAYVLDDNFNRVPCGAVGELYLAGYQIADGYLNREEETKKAFLNNPFDNNEDYAVMYRTGDMARFLPDGSIDIVGRRDNQVKIRGNRVELSEIESTIREIDYIKDVTVQTIKNGSNNELVAYAVTSKEADDFEYSIGDYISINKPDYMVPSFIIELDAIPLTVNGKVDRRALPEVNLDSLRAEYAAPTNENEKLIVEAFENVFKEKISIYDDFVRLGGDSLTAIKLISYLKDFNISAADVLSLRTPKAIAESIKLDDFDLDIYSLDGGCPLNESQLNVYLDIVANDKTDSYLIPLNIKISKDYSLEDVRNALEVMFEVHPILKMRVSDEFDVPYLVKGSKPSIVESDISDEFLTGAFDLNDSLCRFLIAENDDKHELYAVFHHIIFDALSEGVFKEDLKSILDGKVIDVDDSFLKVAAFNQQIRDSEEYDEAKMFYDSILADIDDVNVLLPSIGADGPGIAEIDLDFDLDLFKSFINSNGISENVLFTSVFAYTLSRFAGGDKALFNIVENGRDRFGNFDSIGMYVNTLPILVDCKNQDAASFAGHVSDLVYNVMRYNYYPFKELANKYDVDSSILFQFMPDWFGDDDGLIFDEFVEDMDDLIADFVVNVIQKGGMYRLSTVYSDKYSGDIVQRFMESYRLILQEIIGVNELEDINYVSQSDLECLDAINQTESPLRYNDVLDAFNDNLAKCPDGNLVSFNDKTYSYAEGAFIANEISNSLKDLGVERQDNVAFLVERSELYTFCILGILSAGAVYVPLDDAHPDSRMQLILDDVDARVVIASDETYERAKFLANDSSVVLNISDIINQDKGRLSALPNAYGNLACILYTSGTTGIPKGVKITRKAIANYADHYVSKSGMNRDDVFALYASIGFDVGAVKSICAPFYCGACLSVIPHDIRLDIKKLNEYFIRNGVTHANLPTQVAKLFTNEIKDTPLKILVTGGEKLGEINYSGDYSLLDAYGPTECCVSVSAIEQKDKIDSSSIGYLFINTKAYVLDNEGRRVPVGAVGELCIAGSQVADGYLNREDETEKAFIPNPFEDGDYGVMYRTGDMVRILPDESLGIVGRRDKQVKIRGNRVELSEVEAAIREIDFIDDVTVQTFKNKSNHELVAYVVVNEEFDDIDLKNNISSYVGDVKPDYMIPSFVVKLDEIPLNVNGKVDKSALPKVDLDSLRAEYVPPTTEKEKHIANAFEVVFNRERIGLFDDFLRLGGDSITAIRVISMLREKGIFCIARDILNYKTPYLIAQHVNENAENVSYDAVEGEVGLHPIQEFFFNQININNYTQEFVLKAEIDLDIDILQRAFDELCNVHDMLRVVYKFDDGVIQEILPTDTRICDVKEHVITDNFNDSMLNILVESVRSMDMQNHLIDVNLIRYENRSYLSIVCHHLIIDGVSWNALLTDLTYIYFRLLAGKEIELTRPYPYKNWVEDVRELVENITDEEKQHWIEINSLLDDSNIKGSTKVFAFNFDADYDADNLMGLSEEEYLALAIARAYKKTYGEDIIFSRESYGRDDSLADVSRTLGWFTSIFPALVKTNNGSDSISLMSDVYSIKGAFRNIKNLGLNYNSLIYTTHELEYKHCPVTFNFLSSEFVFKNELFESMNRYLSKEDKIDSDRFDSESYGVTFNISHEGDSYILIGDYASGTYIGNEFDAFIENIKSELEFISNFRFEDEGIVCCLSEEQLGVYLDEKVHDKGTAYATTAILECGGHSIDEIKNAIGVLVDKHPILKGRILDTKDMPLLICDNYPVIDVINDFDHSSLVKPFDLSKSLASFFIVDDDERFVFYHIHHIITDATSGSVIRKDFERALNDELDDAVDLGFVRTSIDAYESSFKPEYESALEFYNEVFAGIGDVQYLVDDVDGCVGKVSLPIRGVRKPIERFAHERGITINNLLNAVFAYAYSRFTGSEKVYFTFTEHGRHERYSEDALGMFVRTIPIIVDCKDKPINDYVDYVSDLTLESMMNSIYPFRLLATEFDLTNDVGFEYNYDLNDVSHIGDDIVFSDEADSVCEFLCVVNDLDDGYLVGVNHSDKFSQKTAERFVKVFKEVLVQCLDKENLKDIDYVSNEDIELLDSYNQTEHDLRYNDVLDAFNDNLSKCPNGNLVSYGDRVYTYGEGAYIADKIAEMLIESGVKAQDCVAFLTERSEHYLFSVLAILSIGGVYVPLDDAHPDERLQYMLDDTQSKVIIVSDETYKRADNLTDDDIVLLNISDIVNDADGILSSLSGDYGNLACILYTSGTTGVPKGVKITRKAIANYADHYVSKSGMGHDDVFALYASIGFDVGAVKSICAPFYCGACLNIVPQDIRLDIKKLNEHFIRNGVTHANLPTQVAKLFINEIKEVPLKILVTGGEKLGEINDSVDYLLVDAYGPTECCVSVSAIEQKDKIDPSSVGYLFRNTKAYVLDNENRRVPVGAVGELCIAGSQVADGYLNREDETRKAFRDNPFDDEEGYGHIYKTGDMVRFLPDGTLGIIGRRDGQVKIRGNRVELPEVESVIRGLDYVEDVTVQTIKNGENHELVAYVVPDREMDNLKELICGEVQELKPDYMVPSFVIELDSIPFNVNGKVDRHALPEVNLDSLRAEYVAPSNETEKQIVEAFEKVFNQEKISIHDDFIRLGGDSLTAIRLVSYLGDYNVTVADILSLHTPHAIAENIDKFELDLNAYSLESGCPLNESQLNIYLDIKANDKLSIYTIPLSMDISKKFNVDDIKAALNAVLDAHPILGMCVSDEFEVPYLVEGSNPCTVMESDVGDDFIIEFLTREFDLEESLCRFLIIENDDAYTLFAVFHHLIFDALSVGVFKEDLSSALEGESISMDDSFLKSSAFSQQIQDTEEFDEAGEFYESMLADSDECNLLLDEVSNNQSGVFRTELDLDSNLFKSFLQEHGISENVVFTTAFAYTLSRFAGSSKVKFNMIESGRDRFNNLNSIGMYVNTLPVLVNCENRNVSDFMQYSSNLIYNVMKYNYYPFRLLASKYDVDSNILFQFMPYWLDNDDADTNELLHSLMEDIGEVEDSITDLNVNIFQKGNVYYLSALYSEKYSKEMIERFAESYKLIVSQLIDVDELSEITHVSKSDLEILDSYNQTEHDLEYDDILDAFNDNLSKCPDNGLVSMNGTGYSYGEGAFIADRIAEKLREAGVKEHDCVAFLTERSQSYMFSVLGIMATGAVYVPLDDSHPDERIEFILNDTQSKVIIASDETFERARRLAGPKYVINISDILNGDVGTLSELPVSYGDLACILYTSGTTGIPKGVKITRRSVLNLSASYCDGYGLTDNDVYGLFSNIGFDAGSWGILSTVYAGACLEIIPEEIRLDIDAMNEYFIQHGVTQAFMTTQVGKLFAEKIEDTSLNLLGLGGEKVGEFESQNNYDLADFYGPTEAYVYIASSNLKDKIDYSSVGNLGYNTKVYVLDEEFRRVPIGAVGELYLSGYQIADGYLNRDEETNSAFLVNPFTNDESYGVLYRTGDIVRLLPDGSLGIVGRGDSQVKIRGNRVELSEIESVIRELEYVDDVTVQTVKHDANNEIVAYVVANKEFDEILLKEAVCSHVVRFKPTYMVPAFVIALNEIPLNVNGKVDKHALPEVDFGSLRVEYVAPTNDKEKAVVEAFEKVFNQEKVGINDNFITLGGDSLTAIKLVSHLKDYNISVADVLQFHTPKAICENVKEIDLDFGAYSLESGCPLNEPQLNVYLDIVANNKFNSYHIPLAMEIPDSSSKEISDALVDMVEIHPILGMCISEDYEVPYLVKGSEPSITIERNADDEFINEFLQKPFDLQDSLSRFLIVENNDKCSLFAVFHHLIFDGLSEGVFRRDLETVLDGGNIDVDDSFLKVSTFNQQIKHSDEYAEANNFYDAMLADYDECDVLLDSVSCEGPGICRCDLELEKDSLKTFLDKHGVSENVVFVSAFAYALSRFAGSDKVLFNMHENGRDRFANYDSIGMHVTTLPILADCKNQDIASFMEHMSKTVYGAMKYNYYPFRLLAKEYDIDSNISFQFLPEWMDGEDKEFDKIKISSEGLAENAISDFEVGITQDGDKYRLTILHSQKYSKDLIERFMESYKSILLQLTSVDNLSEIDYTSDSDIELLNTYNRTETPLAHDDVMDAFNHYLSRYPNDNLVSYGEKVYTYAEGAYIADKIAEMLIESGVKAQDSVAFLTERSEYYMFSVLAIMSIGGVYVPLDDAHPDERLQYMLNDTQSKVVIVSDETLNRAENLTDDNIVLLNISDIVNNADGTLSRLSLDYGDLACILYTSGTTGIPKGVKITRKAITNYVDHYVNKSGMDHDDVFALYASIGFDVGAVKSICAPFYCGACLSIIPQDIRLDIKKLNEHFIENGVTHANLPTQVGKLFINEIKDTPLKILVTGGEKLGEIDHSVNYSLIDAYGPTECCVSISAIEQKDKIDPSSVGYLFRNTKAYVLDNENRRVPIGAVGELCIAGSQVAEGYLNREDETERAFTDNPFDDEEGYEHIYKTGDMVRFLPDGTLGIIGRRDGQVKIRGNRVELPEVESVIRGLDCVEDVTVQTIKNGENHELVAYVVPTIKTDNLREMIRGSVRELKPDYMVPSFVIELDSIPFNVNGKVDRHALPEVDLDSLRAEYVAPENETESFFAKCFEKLLNIDKVGATDDFFELGGDSLLVIKIIMEAINNGYSISYKDVFDNPTPRLLSKVISSEEQNLSIVEDNYDYSLIDDLLKRNNIDSFDEGECSESLGNVLLTGATGFLGIHLLNELLENEDGDIYCLVRGNDDQTPDERLKSAWNYYFKIDISEFEDRVHVVEGNITNRDDFKRLSSYEIDTVINSAANVKHYAQGSELKDINLGGTVNALEFAKTKGARFVQISTVSVAGERVDNFPPKEVKFNETDLFIGQIIDNKYVESKFLAERKVLEAAVDYGLDVKIMRVGNLMARSYDGMFQRNYDTNAFVNNLKSFVTIGKMPLSFAEFEAQFSAIDITAKSIISLSKAPKGCCMFHPYTNRNVSYRKVVDVFNSLGLSIELCDDDSFDKSLNEILEDESKREGIFGLVTRLDNSDVKLEAIEADNDYTLKLLSEFGIIWPEITENYLQDFIKLLNDLDFFKI